MSTTEAPREQEQVIGTVSGLIQKGPEKIQVAVMPDGSQYAKHIWIGKDHQAQFVPYFQGMMGQRIAILANVSHWTMNDGTPVRSLWVDQVGPPEVGSPALAGPPQAAPAPPPPQPVAPPAPQQSATVQPTVTPMQAAPVQQAVSGDVKEQRIHRQTASKVAAIMLTHVAPEERTMSTLLVLSERLVAYYNEGLPELPEMQGAQTLDDLITQATPDDIPF